MRANHKKTRTKCSFDVQLLAKCSPQRAVAKVFPCMNLWSTQFCFLQKKFNEKKFSDFLQQFFSLVPLRKKQNKFWILLREPKSWQKQKTTEEKSVSAILSLFRVRRKNGMSWKKLTGIFLFCFLQSFAKKSSSAEEKNLCYQIIFEKKIGLNCGWEEKLWKLLLPDKVRKKICPKP